MYFQLDNTLHLHSDKSLYVSEFGIYIQHITNAQNINLKDIQCKQNQENIFAV